MKRKPGMDGGRAFVLHLLLALPVFMLANAAVLAQSCDPDAVSGAPDGRFIVVADEVVDRKTGLIWQHCSLGQSGKNCGKGEAQRYYWGDALQAAAELQWRLPSLKELQSLIALECSSPAINGTIFPNTPPDYYWSASPSAGDPDAAWQVHFGNGNSYTDSRSQMKFVRLVRGGD